MVAARRVPDAEARSWYVARIKPHAEIRTAAILDDKGIQVFLPHLLRVRGRHATPLREPLFRSYAFVHLDLTSDEALVARSAPGVQYLLGHDTPCPVPDELVEAIRLRTEAENEERGEVGFRHGEKIRILVPHLRHLEAIFDRRLSAAGRARVFITVLGRTVPIDLHLQQIEGL